MSQWGALSVAAEVGVSPHGAAYLHGSTDWSLLYSIASTKRRLSRLLQGVVEVLLARHYALFA
jgi:hypothetical protein